MHISIYEWHHIKTGVQGIFISEKTIQVKEIESLKQTQIFESLYLCNFTMSTFDILNLDHLY